METQLDFREIAERNGLDYIETTSAQNGYPSNIKGAIIGFETFEQAQQLADKFGYSVQMFKKKDGWALWTRNNNNVYSEMENTCEDYGDDYSQLGKMDEEDFIENEVVPFLEDVKSFRDMEEILKIKKEVWEAIDEMDDDELVITHCSNYSETIKSKSMHFYHDTWSYVIGCIKD